MAGFGGFGTSGGFGSTNNASTGFGGFGSTNNNNNNQQQTTGFGASTNTGFGATNNNAGGGLFGSNNAGSSFGAGGGFGSGAGTFGQNKTGFGASTTNTSTGGGLFGSNTATAGAGFGGFGSSANTGTGFGGANTTSGGGLFGQSKPAFGGGGTTSLFGGGNTNTNTGGFGATNNNAASTSFGAGSGSAFGSTPQNNGTGSTPFAAHTDKDPGAANATNQYQSITAMPVYQAFSPEELRVVDYAQGRKFGTAGGQVGGFGSSSFGGFGANNNTTNTNTGFGASTTGGGGLFGSTNNNTTGGFGATNTGTGFGSSTTGGGLFGSKPATGGLFGSTTTSAAPASGGLFGSTTGGFGSTTNNTGGGLFGQQANKPAGGGFSFGNSTANTTGGFGATNTSAAGGGLFGSSTATAAPFGGASTNAGGGFGFGQTNTAQQPAQTGGLFGGGGGFGAANNTAAKPGGLFGSSTTNTGGGLFGSAPAQPAAGGLFGNTNTQQQSGGLFGSAAKPAGTGLFGNTNTAPTGGGLFGNTQPAQTGGLFGSTNNQSTTGGLFGAKPAQTGGLFGSTATQQPAAGGGLFGGLGNSQQQQPALGGSLFGSTMQQPQQAQQPQGLTASLTGSVYGSPQLFAGLESPAQNPGPIATPLNTGKNARKQAIIPAYRINPAASSRLITPQKRPTGYGFNYSTYGTPGSAMSNTSPMGLGNSLMAGGSLGRSLGKSISSSNLRHSFTAQNSLLLPDAFSGSARSSTGSMKKLNINRNLKVRSLFGEEEEQPTRLKKKVSFDDVAKANGAPKDGELNGVTGALVPTEQPSPADKSNTNGDATGKELAIVHEEGSPSPGNALSRENAAARLNQRDQKLGEYWMKPSLAEAKKMGNKRIKKFLVGREGAGQVEFSEVNLDEVNLDEIMGTLVVIEIRRATVYPETTQKPPQGHGLNVPSLITLENAWPRAQAGKAAVLEKKGKRFEKHLERLKRIPDCEFVDYDTTTGRWSFRVPHFTTYGLDDEDDEDDTTMLSDSRDLPTPTPFKQTPRANGHIPNSAKSDRSMPSPPESDVDDTFDFKKLNSSRRKELPGGYDQEDVYEDEDDTMGDLNDAAVDTPQSFLDERSVGSLAEDDEILDDDHTETLEVDAEGESESGEDQEMAGSFPLTRTTEPTAALRFEEEDLFAHPDALFGLSMANGLGTPMKPNFAATWTEQLQRTVSPRKQDRRALRESQAVYLRAVDEPSTSLSPSKPAKSAKKLTTSIDLMNELFGQSTAKKNVAPPKQSAGVKGLELPAAKRSKVDVSQASDPLLDQSHAFCKPRWASSNTLIYTLPGNAIPMDSGLLVNVKEPIVGEHKDVRFAKFAQLQNQLSKTIDTQKVNSTYSRDGSEPIEQMITSGALTFEEMASAVKTDSPAGVQEKHLWELASILFDEIPEEDLEHSGKSIEDLRTSNLSTFWKKLVRMDAENQINSAKTPEQRALIWLTCGDIEEACAALLEGKDFRLATMVAQLPGGRGFHDVMAKQIEEWRRLDTFSEFDDTIRMLYELLAGNVCLSEGKAGPRENVLREIRFSEELNLDWRRAFGLRLWYSGVVDIDEAVVRLCEDLENGSESVKTTPWFVTQGANQGWDDSSPESRQDALLGLLKLYTARNPGNDIVEASLAPVIEPANVSGNPLDARLSFQLYNLLSRHPAVQDSVGTSVNQGDMLTQTYAEALVALIESSPDSFKVLETAVWVLLHLSSPAARETQIRELLNTHAPLLSPADRPITYFSDFNLYDAQNWEYAAKAMYARAVDHDPVAECTYLLRADAWHDAHTVLCKTIGPDAIISREHEKLKKVLDPMQVHLDKESALWNKGAGIYYEYLQLCDLEPKIGRSKPIATTTTAMNGHVVGETSSSAAEINTMANHVKNLVHRLADKKKQGAAAGENKDIRESIALQLMAEDVARMASKTAALNVDHKELLEMPLSSEICDGFAREAAVEYYRRLLDG